METTARRVWFDDLAVGERFITDSYEVTSENLHDFAAQFDPQGIHLDAEVAAREFFGGIVASGWQVLCVSMKLMVESKFLGATPLIGMEVNGIRFQKPVVPGDMLYVEAEITESTPSSRSDRGYIWLDLTTFRNSADPVCTQEWKLLVPRRGTEQ